MSPEFILVSSLFLLSNGFWMYYCGVLINKLMSRDFVEYEQTKGLSKKTRAQSRPDEVALDDPDADRQAKELNSLFNIA